MKKVILFGGSFDPIHYGHLNMAKQALLQEGAFELWFIPTAISPFKNQSSDFNKRCRMIEMMISDQDKMKVCRIESTLPQPSYTFNTVLELKKQHPNIHFQWLIGDDQLEKLHLWYEFEQLNQEVEFIVYSRDEVKHDYSSVIGEVMEVSSTAIRQGTQFKTKPSILRYMMQEGLYLDIMTQHRLSQFRYEHTLRVTELALEIGAYHNMDTKQIRLAAMMHDYCKEDYSDISFVRKDVHKALYHGYAAASTLSKYYYVKDRDLLRSIKGHVVGASTSKLGMLLYIADKCERGRKYNTEVWIAQAKKDLQKTFKKLKEFTQEYRKED